MCASHVIPPPLRTLALSHALLLLRSWLEPRRALLAQKPRFAVATLEGERFTIDVGHADLILPSWDDAADVTVLTNARTLSDLVSGQFDPRFPGPDHIFMWAGDPEAFRVLESATRDADSARGVHLAQLRR